MEMPYLLDKGSLTVPHGIDNVHDKKGLFGFGGGLFIGLQVQITQNAESTIAHCDRKQDETKYSKVCMCVREPLATNWPNYCWVCVCIRFLP